MAHYAIIARYYGHCVVSGPTALSLYGLADEYIDKIDVDIANTTNLKNALLNVHRVAPSKLEGITQQSFVTRGIPFKIKIYTPERSLHEAYKYYRLSDSFYRALKRYRRSYLNAKNPAKQYDEILHFDNKAGSIIINFLKMEDVDEVKAWVPKKKK
jgi:hypothetical protein